MSHVLVQLVISRPIWDRVDSFVSATFGTAPEMMKNGLRPASCSRLKSQQQRKLWRRWWPGPYAANIYTYYY